MMNDTLDARFPLAFLPTPLQRCDRLRASLVDELGESTVPTIHLKRDDQTGLALGGNKTRKLEYLMAEALDRGATEVVTEGGWQSNHCRQTAAAARRAGLACTLVVNYDPVAWVSRHPGIDEAPTAPPVQGNLLLDVIYGASVRVVASGSDRKPAMQQRAAAIENDGGRPCLIPTGGSNATGSLGYVNACRELSEQYREAGIAPACTYCAWGSGGTFAGMIVGSAAFGLPGEVKAVLVVPAEEAREAVEDVWPIVTEAAERLGLPASTMEAQRQRLAGDNRHIGAGYGIPTDEAMEAIRRLVDTEAVLLDPVYTAKAFAALLGDIRAGRFTSSDHVVFLHTGGAPVLFDPLHPLVGPTRALSPAPGSPLAPMGSAAIRCCP